MRIISFIITILICISLMGCHREPKIMNEIVAPGYSQHAVIIYENDTQK